jgi:hypothetical protein
MTGSSTRGVTTGWRLLFLVAAVYDIALGIAFMVAGEAVLDAIGMVGPPHVAYIQLAAVFVTVQGVSYLFAWWDASANRAIVWVGVIYKAGYTGLAAWYLLLGMIPSVFFIPWAFADLAFLVAFLVFLRRHPGAVR